MENGNSPSPRVEELKDLKRLQPEERPRRGRRWLLAVCIFLFLWVMLACLNPWAFEVLTLPIYFLFGWAFFIVSALPQLGSIVSYLLLELVIFAFVVIGLIFIVRLIRPELSGVSLTKAWGLSLMLGISVLGFSGFFYTSATLLHSKERMWEPHPASLSSQIQFHSQDAGDALSILKDENQPFPPGGVFNEQGVGEHSFFALLLPHVDNRNSQGYDARHPWDAPQNANVITKPYFRIELHYDYPGYDGHGRALSEFATNIYVAGLNRSLSPSEIPDGASNTFILGEAYEARRPWADPVSFRDPLLGFNTHTEGFGVGRRRETTFVVMADGSVRELNVEMQPDVWMALGNPHDEHPYSNRGAQ
ncbi:AI-2E family transporter [Calycomorphotria hydatis]|uniref:DUF1559 domain-containing protein n=1 Tax=Calycomorphotria hydatis TaxID=2528027 RepID=A0A517TEW0_9PLAN|nr:hypothetical protein [Calycomorphotria hydatis]QDT66906.1 hypothetical protein V22_41780 [Calycomorphotria hydatis]